MLSCSSFVFVRHGNMHKLSHWNFRMNSAHNEENKESLCCFYWMNKLIFKKKLRYGLWMWLLNINSVERKQNNRLLCLYDSFCKMWRWFFCVLNVGLELNWFSLPFRMWIWNSLRLTNDSNHKALYRQLQPWSP